MFILKGGDENNRTRILKRLFQSVQIQRRVYRERTFALNKDWTFQLRQELRKDSAMPTPSSKYPEKPKSDLSTEIDSGKSKSMDGQSWCQLSS